jgi:hypothetical protein
VCAWSGPVHAYRPFDSTDADVAKQGEIELECGPFGYIVDGDSSFLVAPAAILNYGAVEGWEIVVEGRNFVRLNAGPDERRDRIRDAALSVKGLLREGSIQGRVGPSIPTEVGLLLPTVGDERAGASFAGIVSQRWSAFTVHMNGALLLTHEHTIGGFAGGIVEGPFRWRIRPVAEFTIEQAAERTVAALAGASWNLRDGLSIDTGCRVARSEGVSIRESRVGFTWGIPVRSHSDSPSGSVRPRGRMRV